MDEVNRFFAEVAYRGTAYHGWQRQPNAISVQQVIEETMGKFLVLTKGIVASGRTDAGVHCLRQYFHFDVPMGSEVEGIQFKLNKMLPPDISVSNVRSVNADAHARFDAVRRSYVYRISPKKNPFADGLVWHFGQELDLEKMNEAAKLLLTFEDFQALSKVNTDVNHFLCKVDDTCWFRTDGEIRFRISANRFLRGMVRAIVGTCIDIGRGRTGVEDFEEVLKSRDRRKAGPSAPPEGLYLSNVEYPEQIFKN